MDLQSYSRWYDYSRARDAMFAATDTAWAPWYVAHTDDKKRGRLNIISHLLSQVPYEPLKPGEAMLPKRQGRTATSGPTCRCGASRPPIESVLRRLPGGRSPGTAVPGCATTWSPGCAGHLARRPQGSRRRARRVAAPP